MNFSEWEICGWLATVCFSLCGVPQAIKSIKEKHSNGVSWGLLILWLLGEIFATIYILPKRDLPLLVNYAFNTLFIVIILYYKIRGCSHEETNRISRGTK